MNLYVFAFSTTVFPKIHFYFEENRQHGFVVFFRIISMLLFLSACRNPRHTGIRKNTCEHATEGQTVGKNIS